MPADCSSVRPSQIFWPFSKILPCDLDPIAQLERLEVGGGDAADHRQGDGLLVVAAGDGGGPRRPARGAVLAPEIELVARGEFGIEYVEYLRAHAADTGARSRVARGAQIERGQQRCAGNARLRVRFLDAGYRDRQGRRCCARASVINSSSCAEPKPCHQSGVGHTAESSWAIGSCHFAGTAMSGRL